MEEKSVEIPKIKGPLREQDSIRALLELLEQQGMEQEKGDVIRMADHIDSMEMQLGTVLKELGEVKKQLGVMQESKVKLFAVNTIQKAEHQVKTLRFQVGEWKRKFVERAEQAVFDFKEKGNFPLFGICLGHQMIGLAYGAGTYKLKFGHRGGNHPVKNLKTGKIEITSQNHSYAVDYASLKNTDLEMTHINLLDHTVEGIACRKDHVFSVQYHPESAPGPQDSGYLFDQFIQMMEENKHGKAN